MATPSASLPADMPDIWGEGALFAYSGLDGPTDSASGFVAGLGPGPLDLVLHTPLRRLMRVRAPGAVIRVAAGDLLLAESSVGPVVITWLDCHTIVGEVSRNASVELATDEGVCHAESGGCAVSRDRARGDFVVLRREGDRFVAAFGWSLDDAHRRAADGARADLAGLVPRRLQPYRGLPTLPDASESRLLKKCLSVMRVNHLGPEGVIGQRWSTSSRVPHRCMYLWDAVFHSFAMNHVDPVVAFEDLKSALDFQRPDGMIPHTLWYDGRTSGWTQPPLLAWGVWENYRRLRDRDRLAWAWPRLEAYLEWDLAHRDADGNGLLEWGLEGDVHCRCSECGLDNSPVYDDARPADAPDFTAEAVHDIGYLARIGDELGCPDRAEHWRRRAGRMAQALHRELWDEARGFYFARRLEDRRFVPVQAVTGFFPMLAPGMPAERAGRLVGALRDRRKFDPGWPAATTAADEPAFGNDMWRGPVWVNTNYLVWRGLREQGLDDDARWLRDRTIDLVGRWYAELGVLFEFYDARGRTPPTRLDRKGPVPDVYDLRGKRCCIRDYHWTAAVAFALLFEKHAAAAV